MFKGHIHRTANVTWVHHAYDVTYDITAYIQKPLKPIMALIMAFAIFFVL